MGGTSKVSFIDAMLKSGSIPEHHERERRYQLIASVKLSLSKNTSSWRRKWCCAGSCWYWEDLLD
jgi:hypothetical protein